MRASAQRSRPQRRTTLRSAGRLVFNPGECAGHLPGHNAVGVLDLATLETEILLF